jgi:Arc/MetJ-type ribon-helix-helix transcriptional regulator
MNTKSVKPKTKKMPPKGAKAVPAIPKPKRRIARKERERVLIEFPSPLLQRADETAAKLGKNRSELIRTAVEQLLDGLERKHFYMELASAYQANAAMNLDLAGAFAHADKEGAR